MEIIDLETAQEIALARLRWADEQGLTSYPGEKEDWWLLRAFACSNN